MARFVKHLSSITQHLLVSIILCFGVRKMVLKKMIGKGRIKSEKVSLMIFLRFLWLLT